MPCRATRQSFNTIYRSPTNPLTPVHRAGRQDETMADITQEQQKMLEPFGQIFAGMGKRVREMPDDELRAMLQACYVASTTNCWACTFDAAQWLQKELRRESHHREKLRATAAQ